MSTNELLTADVETSVTVDHDQVAWVTLETGDDILTLEASLEAIAAVESLGGIVLTWKDAAADSAHAPTADDLARVSARLRAIETSGIPIVAVIDRPLRGLDAQVALAAHQRIALGGASLAFPQIANGRLPGLGGVTRLARVVGVSRAWEGALLSGRAIDADAALRDGLVDFVVPDALTAERDARELIAGGIVTQRWDRPGHRIPGPHIDVIAASLAADQRRRDKGAPYPAPRAALAVLVEGSRLTPDAAFAVELRYQRQVSDDRTARNLAAATAAITLVRDGQSRPAGVESMDVSTIAVLGAGMMGRGIAYQAAINGLNVRILDAVPGAAESATAWVADAVTQAVARGRVPASAGVDLVQRVTPAFNYAELTGSDMVIEAIVEDLSIKREVLAALEPHVAGALIASNTSSLPITALAEALADPSLFIGTHFFSPVERMELLEIVVGEATSPIAVATAFDVGRLLGKTPIIVKDVQGFFTSRVIQARMDEALAMIGEGVPAISIERASLRAGYPVGMLQFMDEVTLTLPRSVRAAARAAAAERDEEWIVHPAEPVMNRLVEEFGRVGRAAGGGFYDYDGGKRTGLWPGLHEHFSSAGDVAPLDDLADRLVFAESLAAVAALAHGIVGSEADGDVGTLLGLAFPRWTGGAITFVRSYPGGAGGFLERADELAERYAAHLRPSPEARALIETWRES